MHHLDTFELRRTSNPQPHLSSSTDASAIELDISLFEQQFQLQFSQVETSLTTADVEVHSVNSDGSETIAIERIQSEIFESTLDNGGWASLGLRDDGRFHLTLFDGTELYQVDPFEHHEQQLDQESFRQLAAETVSGMVVFRSSDIEYGGRLCGTETLTSPDGGEIVSTSAHDHDHDDHEAHGDSSITGFLSSLMSRFTPKAGFTPKADFDPITPFPGRPSTKQMVNIGIAVNIGVYSVFNSVRIFVHPFPSCLTSLITLCICRPQVS